MSRYCFDSNIFIYHLDGNPTATKFFSNLDQFSDILHYSFITQIELLGYPELSENERLEIRKLLNNFLKIGMNDEIEEIVIRLRLNRGIKIPDAIIAASALYTGCTLITHNTKDYKNIPNLNLFDPFV